MNLPGRVIDLVCIALAQRIKKEILNNTFYKESEFENLYRSASKWYSRIAARDNLSDLPVGEFSTDTEALAVSIRKECLSLAIPLKNKLKTITDQNEYFIYRNTQDEIQELMGRTKTLIHLCDIFEMSLDPEEMLGEMRDVLYRHLGAFYATSPVVNELKKILAQY